MTFDEYTAARRSKKWGIDVDDDEISEFILKQPESCQSCGCRVFDPFGYGIVVHDVHKCEKHNAQSNPPAVAGRVD